MMASDPRQNEAHARSGFARTIRYEIHAYAAATTASSAADQAWLGAETSFMLSSVTRK